jgi:hypothetical protein
MAAPQDFFGYQGIPPFKYSACQPLMELLVRQVG